MRTTGVLNLAFTNVDDEAVQHLVERQAAAGVDGCA